MIKFFRKTPLIILALILVPLFSYADENINVTIWQEKSYLNNLGKNSEILIKAKIKNLPKDYSMTSFSLNFGTGNAIQIKNVTCDSKPTKNSFANNVLKVEFPTPKKNDENFTIYISYAEQYKKINHFLREEAILIPSFAAGANARVVIDFPGNMESATLNNNITKSDNSFIYQNIVPSNGVTEIIKLTPSQSSWKVTSKVTLKSNQALKGATVELPDYFFHAKQKVENRGLFASVLPKSNKKEGNKYILKFDSDKTETVIEHRATITTGKNVRKQPQLKLSEYLNYDIKDRELLNNVLQNIKRSPNYKGLPLYAQIGIFTHNFIKYDKSYIGKIPSVRLILENPIGVCTEYANLFNALARAAGIPSLVVNGMACGKPEECEGHAWNMIYYNNQWLEVDATWNLMSGVVSSSHVYFSDNDEQSIGITYPGDGRVVDLDVSSEMKNIN
jgi:hypothetical protein